MASYFSMGAYDATILVPGFAGLYQEGDGLMSDPRYALEAVNVETKGGVLSPAAAPIPLPARLDEPIETLASFYRRWHEPQNEREVLIAASGGKLYWMFPHGNKWAEIALPGGVEAFQKNVWSFVAYEENPEGSSVPVDVLLMSNDTDGMICVHGDDLRATLVKTPKKFGQITRYAERIWGGAIKDDPDMLVYSAPYDPFNWEANAAIPEDGAGDIMQPSWDGDSFSTLTNFGDQLVAFKDTKAWRIYGTDPGEYAFTEQYGGGAPYPETIAVNGYAVLMLGENCVQMYDGSSVFEYQKGAAKLVFERVNRERMNKARGCFYKGAYYLALPLDGANENNAVLVFDSNDKTWVLRENIYVASFLSAETALYFTSSVKPGTIFKWGEDAAESGALPCRWVSGWMDLGYRQSKKGGFALYLSPVSQVETEIEITIRTEKKGKTKTMTVKPDGKYKRLQISGSGRRFRFEIESKGTVSWTMKGGIEIVAEIDRD